jgi:hypothetical protein
VQVKSGGGSGSSKSRSADALRQGDESLDGVSRSKEEAESAILEGSGLSEAKVGESKNVDGMMNTKSAVVEDGEIEGVTKLSNGSVLRSEGNVLDEQNRAKPERNTNSARTESHRSGLSEGDAGRVGGGIAREGAEERAGELGPDGFPTPSWKWETMRVPQVGLHLQFACFPKVLEQPLVIR